ncbi:MAG: glycosyltransferase family 2 protein [Candidatus Omnitrophota bacterium]
MNNAQPPKVSVVLPAYNRERTILRALNSVLSQTFADFEILAVDDGSADGTIKAIQSCADPRIRCLRHEKNRGAAAARNTGIKAARGEYVAFLDSDDEWLPQKLELQTAALDACCPETGGNSTWTFDHFPQQERTVVHSPRIEGPFLKHIALGCDLRPGTALMIRRSVYDDVGLYDDTLTRLEDWDWLLRFAQKYTLDIVKEPLAHIHMGAMPPTSRVEAPTLAIIQRFLHPMTQFGRLFRQRAIALQYMLLAAGFFRDRRYGKGFRYFLKGFSQYPLQRPGTLVFVLDSLLGTSLALRVSQWKRRLFGSAQ